MFYRQSLRTTNDTNGNPRRLWAIYSEMGGIVKVIEEGYRGRDGLPESCELPPVEITPAEYRAWKEGAKERGTYEPR